MSMKISNAKKYLDLYNQEEYLFNFIGPKIKKRGFINFQEFFKICMWKSVRQKNNYRKNEQTIKKITKNAFKESDERKKMEKLCELKGVGIPMASAMLTVVFPDKYAVIDIRCIEMLNKLNQNIKKHISLNVWLEYLKIIRSLAADNNLTPREIDKILFAMHKESLDSDNYKNLYN